MKKPQIRFQLTLRSLFVAMFWVALFCGSLVFVTSDVPSMESRAWFLPSR